MSKSKSKELVQRKEQIKKRLEALDAKYEGSSPFQRKAASTAYLLVDCSSSMRGVKLSQAKKGSIGFVKDALSKGYSIGIISFSSNASFVKRPEISVPELKEKIKQFTARGTTNMTEALHLAREKFSSSKCRGAVVLVTDGMPNDEKAALAAGEKLKSLGVDIITIGVDDANQSFLEQIASREALAAYVPRNQLSSKIRDASKLLPRATNKSRHLAD